MNISIRFLLLGFLLSNFAAFAQTTTVDDELYLQQFLNNAEKPKVKPNSIDPKSIERPDGAAFTDESNASYCTDKSGKSVMCPTPNASGKRANTAFTKEKTNTNTKPAVSK